MEVSNRTLSVILVFAIIISLGGTILSLNKITTLEVSRITGMATGSNETGNVTLNISSVTSIRLETANISFGSGYANGSGYCNLSTVERSNESNCSGFYGDNIPLPIQIENNGNKNVSISLNVSLNGTTMFDTNWTNAALAINVSCNKTNCCDQINSSYVTWRTISETENIPVILCGTEGNIQKSDALAFNDANDILDINVAIWFNQDAQIGTVGQLNSTFTIIGEGP